MTHDAQIDEAYREALDQYMDEMKNTMELLIHMRRGNTYDQELFQAQDRKLRMAFERYREARKNRLAVLNRQFGLMPKAA